MAPGIILVMGVSGSGKTTVASLLAKRLGWEFAEADRFHSPSNVEKMRSGTALTDEDRWPWLRSIAAWIDAQRAAGKPSVIACSALKRSYRDLLIGARPDVALVYLKGDYALIEKRMKARPHHYMPVALLKSQFEALEEPGEDEKPIVVSVEPAPEEIVARIIAALGMGDRAKPLPRH